VVAPKRAVFVLFCFMFFLFCFLFVLSILFFFLFFSHCKTSGSSKNLFFSRRARLPTTVQPAFFLCKRRERNRKQLINVNKIIAVIDATFVVAKRKPEKNSGFFGIEALNSAIPVQRSNQLS